MQDGNSKCGSHRRASAASGGGVEFASARNSPNSRPRIAGTFANPHGARVTRTSTTPYAAWSLRRARGHLILRANHERLSRRWRIVRAARIRTSTAHGSRGTPRYASSRGDTSGARSFRCGWCPDVGVRGVHVRSREGDGQALPRVEGSAAGGCFARWTRETTRRCAPTASILKTTHARREKGRGKRDLRRTRGNTNRTRRRRNASIADLLRSKEKAKVKAAEAAKASKDRGGGSGASTTTNLSDIRVAGFEHESRSELCQLRVQCWLREIRVRRKRVLLELEREEREAALVASGKSPKSTIKLLRKAHGSDRRRARVLGVHVDGRGRGRHRSDAGAPPMAPA